MRVPIEGVPDRAKRELLRLFASAAAGTGLVVAAGCSPGSGAAPGEYRFSIDTIPDGGRVRVTAGTVPIELRRDGDRVSALLLQCTHMGCEVRWIESERSYRCPCHDGRFDAEGRVLSGPPPRSLDELPVRVEGGSVFVAPLAVTTGQ